MADKDSTPQVVTHTPGPWTALPNEFCMVSGDGKKVCLLPGAISPEHEANARLIAAAPKLLAALKELRLASLAYGDATDAQTDAAFARLVLARANALTVIAEAEGAAVQS